MTPEMVNGLKPDYIAPLLLPVQRSLQRMGPYLDRRWMGRSSEYQRSGVAFDLTSKGWTSKRSLEVERCHGLSENRDYPKGPNDAFKSPEELAALMKL